MRYRGSSIRHLVGVLTLPIFFACSGPAGVDKSTLFHPPESQGSSEKGAPRSLREQILGSWEVVKIGGVPIEQLPAEEIPFRLIKISPSGILRMDTFQTEYEVAKAEEETVSLSYNTIGRESFLSIHLTDDEHAEIVETYQEPGTGKKGETRVLAKRAR